MNKFVLPTTLIAVLAIAMVFAIVPVDNAQTLHLPTIGTGQIADDSIGPEDLTGATDAAGFVHLEENSAGAALVVATTAYTPIVSSLAIVTCNMEGVTANEVTADGVITLSEDGLGTVQSAAGRSIMDNAAIADQWAASAQWVVTGITDITIMTCTLSGTGVTAADVTGLEIIALYIPE